MTAEERWGCPECGLGVGADEDGCCSTCGNGCFRTCDLWFTAALVSARAEAFEEADKIAIARADLMTSTIGSAKNLDPYDYERLSAARDCAINIAAAIRAKAKEG